MPEPSLDLSGLKAVIFDLDGTLYRQGPLRRAMALRLCAAHALHPATGLRTLRTITAYRRAQEELRATPYNAELAEAQVALAAASSGLDRDVVARDVDRWIEQAPLDLLKRFAQPGLGDLLASLRSRGIKLAVLSDYQAIPKLQALGIVDDFDVVLCAQEPEIGVFKPDPRGLRVALERLDVAASEALYVGDRAEIDAGAATAAGVPCVILTKTRAIPTKRGADSTGIDFVGMARLSELQSRLEPV